MGTALVVGLLVVMCGAIAYTGDLLGRRMGKKRLSIFNLRPRHTAIVFTVITGMVIAGLTLGALMLLSRGVRIAVTRGEQLLIDNHHLKQQRRRLDLVRRQLVAQREDLEKSNKALLQGNITLKSAQAGLRTETKRLQRHNQALLSKNQALSQRNQRLEARNTILVQGNYTLAERNRTLAATNERLGRANGRLAAASRQLVVSNVRLKDRNRGLQTERDGLVQATRLAQKQLTSLHADLTLTRTDLTLAQKELANAQRELTNAQRVVRDTQAQATRGEDLANGNVIVHRGEELSRRVIPAGAPDAVVRSTLQSLLSDANGEIARRVSTVNGRARQVCLDSADGSEDRIPEPMVAALMTESHPADGSTPSGPAAETHPVVVRAIATRNASDESADPVVIAVDGRMNQLAFKKGDEVAQIVVSTAATTGQLLKSLVAFLHRQVREAAVKHGIMPDASGSVGETDYEELLDVVARVKRLPGHARIGAIAAAEAWSAGPLQLDFYVVPADTRVAKKKGEE